MNTDLAFSSALELAHLVRQGQVSPLELVELFLDRTQRLNPQCNAFVTIAADQALVEAKRQTDLPRDQDLPPFFGVPRLR